MAPEAIQYSDEDRYYKLDNMMLSLCQVLRSIFACRWELETGEKWIDDQDHLQRFIDEYGRGAFKKLLGFHKKQVKSSKGVVEWDLSLLCAVLLNFGEENKYDIENDAVKKLKEIRNFLAHHINKKISVDVYNDKVTIYRESLHSLGIDEKEIAILVERAGTTSSEEALKHLKKLLEEAEAFLKNGQVQRAEKCYSEAVMIPSLLPVNLARAFEERSNYFLQQIKDPLTDVEKCNNALLDVTKALELNKASWRAHYLAGQCYRYKNELSLSINHYQQALAISPAQKRVREELDMCKVRNTSQKRYDHLNPNMMPMNLSEMRTNWEEQWGTKITEKELLHHKRYTECGNNEGQAYVSQGHQYLSGWGVPIDSRKAAEHYGKAAKLKNAEGMYNLSKCYNDGTGVKQNVQEALRILREVAKMNPKTTGRPTSLDANIGVASAQHALGLMFDTGNGIEQDVHQAATWYTKAMENGMGNAANNLAILYYHGRGVAADKKMAELCWKQAIVFRDVIAPAYLYNYYTKQLEPDMVKTVLQIGKEMKNFGLLQVTETELNAILQPLTIARSSVEPELVKFERDYKLSKKGFTVKERLYRMNKYLNANKAKIWKHLENMMTTELGKHRSWGGKCQCDMFTLVYLVHTGKIAVEHSVTAEAIIETLNYAGELNYLLLTGQHATDEQQTDIVNLYYNCATTEIHLVTILDREVLPSLLDKLFKEKGESCGEDEMKIRFCFVTHNHGPSNVSQSGDLYSVDLLKEGIRRYPNNVHYYRLLSGILGYKKDHKLASFYAQEGLKAFPDDLDLLYFLGVHLRMISEEPERSVAMYERFLELAPHDHRKVPEALYQIASIYVCQWKDHLSGTLETTMDLVNTYYQRGLEAEKHQLPCYLPYGCSDQKVLVECFFSITHSHTLQKLLTPINVADIEKNRSIQKRKPYLRSPIRKGIIRLHRERLQKGGDHKNFLRFAKLQQPLAKTFSGMKSISLANMNPTRDNVFENRFIDLVILEDPYVFCSWIQLIAEDEDGDVIRVDIQQNTEISQNMKYFQAGCSITIMNPLMQIGANDCSLRNVLSKNIVYLEKVNSMCRFCGKKDASRRCAKCKRPYCSRECQKLDWEILRHSLICRAK